MRAASYQPFEFAGPQPWRAVQTLSRFHGLLLPMLAARARKVVWANRMDTPKRSRSKGGVTCSTLDGQSSRANDNIKQKILHIIASPESRGLEKVARKG